MDKHGKWFAVTAIIVLTACAFWPSLSNDFVNWDDHEYVLENPYIQGWTIENLRAIWTQSRGANYHPLVFMSHLLEYRLWGLSPAGYHAVNLALHILTSLFVFWFLLELGFNRWAACLTAIWFGVHPLHVESVAWISERKDVLCAAFYMLALWIYVRNAKWDKPRFAWGAITAYMLALLSKPMAVTWPFVVMLCDWYLGKKRNLHWWLEKAVMLAPVFIVIAITWSIQAANSGIQLDLIGNFWSNFLLACRAFAFYLWKLMAPLDLSACYPRTAWKHAISLPIVILIAVIFLVGLAIWAWRCRAKVFLFGLAWYAVTLLPVSGIVPIGFVFAADRYMYLPSIGPLFIISYGIYSVSIRYRRLRVIALPILALSVITLMCITWMRSEVWRNGITLWEDTVQKAPNHLTFRMLAMAQMEKEKLSEAEASISRSLDYSDNQWGRFYCAEILRKQGRHEEAISWYERFLSVQDWYVPALSGYGLSLMAQNQLSRAVAVFMQCVNSEPNTAIHHAHLGWALMDQGRGEEAELIFKTALELDPLNITAHYNYGVLLMREKRSQEAEAHYRRVLEEEPDHQHALVNLGVTLRMQKRFDEAKALLLRALKLHPDDKIAQEALQAIPE